ncbi:MAG: hypothetical protein CL902_02985 [Dehalococcoidia bacterium]|nr:hypothetical protein [Dehalococcoidia bacterium]|tara:strand:+ start:156 stop:803 length:648 start_codon:yes stop_codon:yes gene_type:complete
MPKKIYASVGYTMFDKIRSDVNYSINAAVQTNSGPPARLNRTCVVTDVGSDPLPRGCDFYNSKLSIAQKKGMFASDYDNDTTDGSLDFEVFLVSGDAVVEGEATWDNRSTLQAWATGGGDYFTRDRGHKDLDPGGGTSYADGFFLDMRVGRLMNLSLREGQRRADFICRFRYEGSTYGNKMVGYTDNESISTKHPYLTIYYRKSVMRSRRSRLAR